MLYLSHLISAASGKLNGLVAAHNHGGYYFREYVIPTDPATARQVNCRDAMTACYEQWTNDLSSDERQQWGAFAASKRRPNRMGQQRSLSGYPEFVRQKFHIHQANEQLGWSFNPGNAVPLYSNPFSTPPYLDWNGSDHVHLYWDTDAWPALDDHSAILVYASTSRLPTINFFKGPFQLIGGIDGDPEEPPTPPVNFALQAAVASGQRVFYQLRFIGQDYDLAPPFRGMLQAP
jgi:hypothetical protein